MFIKKHGQDCAERFYFHDIVDSYKGMTRHKEYEERLQEKAPSQQKIDECKEQYDRLREKYGKKFSDHYGWASSVCSGKGRVTFAAIEKDVGLDHMRPYYMWASQNIHAGSKGMRNRLGLCKAKKDILLAGQSNSGMTDPAIATSLSLYQITYLLITINPSLDHLVMMKVIEDYVDEIQNAFPGINSEILGEQGVEIGS
ncbi:MAG: hypothetical protein D3903_04005 [Candidatus Electrothrix sp. GM3_4]|nr:hypothetical protein [Candidatus Electrothrix sp. GM3_4]